jgi:hypothetical protein
MIDGKKQKRDICNATTRKGLKCKRRAVVDNAKCPNHGGLSTGPKTEEGKRRVTLSLVKARAVLKARRERGTPPMKPTPRDRGAGR